MHSLGSDPEIVNFISGNMFPNPEQAHNSVKYFNPQTMLIKSTGWDEVPGNPTTQSNMEATKDDISRVYQEEYENDENDDIGHWDEEKNKFDMFAAYPFLTSE